MKLRRHRKPTEPFLSRKPQLFVRTAELDGVRLEVGEMVEPRFSRGDSSQFVEISSAHFSIAQLQFELLQAVTSSMICPEQISLPERRPAGDGYPAIFRHFKIFNDEGVARAILRTVLGVRWHGTFSGGSLSYLSDLDQARFKETVSEFTLMNRSIADMMLSFLPN